MAKYGSDDAKIEVDNSGGSLVDLSDYITEINEVNVEALLQESTPVGVAWVEQLWTGIKQMQPVTLSGFYDDTASTGPDAVLGPSALGSTRTFQVTYGGTKTTSVECIVTSYVRNIVSKELTRFSATLTPTGTVTEA